MTTTIVYPSAANTLLQQGDTATTAARALARDLTQAATIAERVFANGSGSTTMTSGTFTNTPASGDVLIAVIARRADGQATITNPSGWTKLTGAGTAGSRLLEVWWYRSTGVAADKGSFSWTVTSATNAWGIELIRFGGSAAYGNPVVVTAATAFAASTTPTAQTTTPDIYAELPGMTLNCIAVTGASLGASGITSAFSGTGTAESTTSYYDSTYGACSVSINDIYNNTAGTTTYGAAFTLGASRAGHQALIHLAAGGGSFLDTTPSSLSDSHAAGINMNVSATSYPGAMCQGYLTYDTSSIPDGNTVTSATLGLRADNALIGGFYSTTDPANATLQARYYGTSITDTRGNNNNTWALSPTNMAAKTLVATYAASSAWTAGNDYTLTSQAAFATNINKTGNTVLILTTDDYATSTARSSREMYAYDVTSTYAPLTIVHNLQESRTAAATAGTTPTVTRTYQAARTVASTAGTTPAITRTIALLRTVAATLGLTPTISRTAAFLRSLAATIDNTPVIIAGRGYFRTVAATLDITPAITYVRSFLRTVAATLNLVSATSRAATYLRTISSRIDVTGTITRTTTIARTVAATLGLTPTVARIVATTRSIVASIQVQPAISTASTYLRAIAATISGTPTVQTAKTVTRTIAATIGTIPSAVATLVPLVVGITHTLSLKVQSTIRLAVPNRIRLAVRSRLRLPE